VIPVDQTITGLGRGNCLAACLASILEVACDEVPPSAFSGDQWRWLAARGYTLVRVDPTALRGGLPRNAYYIMTALSPRADTLHAVVCYGDEIVHDPHPQRELGLASGPCEYLFLVPLDPARK
jgi:hypothetical protein